MNILERIKNLFRKKDFPIKDVSVTPKEENLDEEPEKKLEESGIEQKDKIQEKSEIIEEQKKDYNIEEAIEILDSVKINLEELGLDKIQTESETLSSYIKMIIKDLSLHQDFKNEKEKLEQVIKGIGGKIKVINKHGLELKNLLANLEDHYYTPSIDTLKKVNKKVKNEEIDALILDLENDLEMVKNLDAQITKVIGYNELFNAEKNPEYKGDIEKEITKRIIHGDLNDLLSKILTTVIDKSLGIKSKIEKTTCLEKARQIV